MPTTFAVFGSGGWGTAIALLLAQDPDHRVRLWSAREETGQALRECRENARLLPGSRIPESILLTTDAHEAADGANGWVIAVPTVYLRTTSERLKPARTRDVPVISLTKGIESGTFLRPSEILAEILGTERLAVLSGPSHAEEVAAGLPTSVTIAASDLGIAAWAQQHFTTDRFRVYTNPDLIGVELAGALKNVIGIAAGLCDGLNLGDNAKAALLTRGLVEMTRFGVAFGAEPATFQGLAGMGVLITTCFSRHGRNRRVGERLAKGESVEAVLAGPQVAEGVNTARSIHERCERMGVDAPIMTSVYEVLFHAKAPIAAVQSLMTRRPKPETI